jgi:hypothetical protein
MQRGIILSAIILATVFAETSPSVGAGAIAIGRPNDVAKRGISMGFSTNRDTMDAAKERSMILCQDSGTTISSALCSVVATFQNQCVAVAIDPQIETPGFGWAVADSQPAAETRAVSNCRMTAGPTRQDACKVTDSYCDGTPKSNSAK